MQGLIIGEQGAFYFEGEVTIVSVRRVLYCEGKKRTLL
jgi:hypothetical protein